MNWDRLRDWLDNPILVKHVRSRLRIPSLSAAIVVVLVFCFCILWGGYQLNGFANGGAFGALLALQAVILTVMGAGQIGTSVGAARTCGILDFHRVSPLTPTEPTLGFFFGAPVREYVLFACTLPFTVLCVAFGTPSLHGFVQLMILMIACTWVFHGLALLNALLGKARTSPHLVLGLVLFLVFFGAPLVAGASRAAAIVDADLRLQFYGAPLPWLVVVLLHAAAVLYFTYLAARRKMGAERAHALSKPQSIAALVTAAALVVGTIWKRQEFDVLEVAMLYLLVVTAIPLILIVTPSRAEYDKGLWRARKRGLAHLPWWDDLSLNRVFLVILCSVVFLTATIAANGAAEFPAPGFARSSIAGSFPLAIAAGVLVVAYFGLARQYFALGFGGRSQTYFALFLFLAWLVPIVAGTIVSIASIGTMTGSDKTGQIVFALSPVAGLGLIASVDRVEPYGMATQAAAITPALLFTFMFNSLLIATRRRAYRQFLAASAGTAGVISR